MQVWFTIALVVSLLAPIAEIRAASTPGKCAASKQKATGKKAAVALSCYAKAVKKAHSVDPACLGKAAAKFTSAFRKAEAAGGCAMVGDASRQGSAVDAFVAGAVATEPSSTCLVPLGRCGSTCGGSGLCDLACSNIEATPRCVNLASNVVAAPCSSDLDCQAFKHGTVCVSAGGAECSHTVCATPCP